MQIEEIRAEMEEELTWRKGEIVFFKNRMSHISKENEKDRYRKVLVVMLYSHFEGFCKACFLIYLKSINSLGLLRKEVNENLIASSMEDIFRKYDDKDRKCDIFRRPLPNDKEIHRFFRRTDLIIQFNDFLEEKLYIPDKVIDTESNLRYHVMQKNLYRLGIDHRIFEKHRGNINKLVNLRNSIAHGSKRSGISYKDYESLEETVYNMMNELIKVLINSLEKNEFKKKYASS